MSAQGRQLDVQLAEIAVLVQGLDDLITVLNPAPRHRRVVDVDEFDVDPPTLVTPVWPWTPKHVADGGDAA